MESLYVCLFSNGHIKVGRSIDPQSRIAQHAERVACMGVDLVEHHVVPCSGYPEAREADLIGLCANSPGVRRFKSEWFSGLDFDLVCTWADGMAVRALETAPVQQSGWASVVERLRRDGWTQMALAAECKCGQSSISDLSTGRTKDPSYSVGSTLLRLAGLTDLPA